jgi:hypothetical protein
MKLHFVISNPALKASIVETATRKVWSPAVKAFVDLPADAILSPDFSPSITGYGILEVVDLPPPKKVGDLDLVWREPTLPNDAVGQPWPIKPMESNVLVVVAGSVIATG